MANSSAALNVTPDSLPNPFTPMAWLDPELAFQVTVSIYILVGAAAVIIWDILNNIASDIRLLTKYKISIPTVTYFVSRLSALTYGLACVIFETAPINICSRLEKGSSSNFPIAVSSTSLLFFFRLRAIFNKDPYIVGFFGFMWLAVVAGTLTAPIGVEGSNIGLTKYCINSSLKSYTSAAVIIPLVNDTLVFIAISWRLLANSHVEYDLKSGTKAFMYGRYLPAFSRALLQDGQMYYLTTVTSSLLTMIMLYVPSIPVTYRVMFTIPNIMLMNIMACRVYRNTKFGHYREVTISTSTLLGSSRDQRIRNDTIPLTLSKSHRGHQQESSLWQQATDVEGVSVTKVIEHMHDYPESKADTLFGSQSQP